MEWSGLGVDPLSAAAARGWSCPCLLSTTVMSCMERLEDAASSVIPTSPGRKAPRINSTERRAEPSDPYKLALASRTLQQRPSPVS